MFRKPLPSGARKKHLKSSILKPSRTVARKSATYVRRLVTSPNLCGTRVWSYLRIALPVEIKRTYGQGVIPPTHSRKLKGIWTVARRKQGLRLARTTRTFSPLNVKVALMRYPRR